MDPITQGLVGAVVPQAVSKKETIRYATVIGALSGMAPDLDVLIRSQTDHLLWLEFHRHFTHSLFFIPFGALLCSVFISLVLRKKLSFKSTYFYSFLGYGTHGLLDNCTSYGTSLLWPLSKERFAWSIISIIDPVFSSILLVVVLFAYFRRRQLLAQIGLIFMFAYFALGVFQHHRALNIQNQIATKRNHVIEKSIVKPGFGNIILWRSLYEADGRYYVDSIRIDYFGGISISEGNSLPKLNMKEDFPELSEDSVAYKDIERFKNFSQGFLSVDKENKDLITDVRYGLTVGSVAPMWGIIVNRKDPNAHTPFVTFRRNLKMKGNFFLNMIQGRLLI
jgi:inner membrane protein